MTILQKLGRTLNGDTSAYDANGYARTHPCYCEHCHCDVLNAHNHRLDEQCQRMIALVRRIRV